MLFDNVYVIILSGDNGGRLLLSLNKSTDQLQTTDYSCKKKQIICITTPITTPSLSLKFNLRDKRGKTLSYPLVFEDESPNYFSKVIFMVCEKLSADTL